jgi:hypothetical protein
MNTCVSINELYFTFSKLQVIYSADAYIDKGDLNMGARFGTELITS